MIRRFWWLFLVMLPIGAVAGLFGAAIITYVMPKMYESEAVIEVRPFLTQNGASSGSQPSVEMRITPQFFATEFERIKSRNALEKVAKNLELTNRWAMDQESVVQNLKKMIVSQNIRGTDLISIKVRHTNKVDTRDIANEVARNYKVWRNEIERKDAESALIQLKKAVEDQEKKVEESSRKLSEAVPETQKYLDAERTHKTDLELLQSLKLKLIGEGIRIGLPNENVVIHENAVIPNVPISPNVALNLSLGTILGLFISPFMALPLMWILNRSIKAK